MMATVHLIHSHLRFDGQSKEGLQAFTIPTNDVLGSVIYLENLKVIISVSSQFMQVC